MRQSSVAGIGAFVASAAVLSADPPPCESTSLLTGCGSPACALNDGGCDVGKYSAATNKGEWDKAVGTGFVADRRPGYVVLCGTGDYHATYNPFQVTSFWLDCNDDGILTYPDGGSCTTAPVGGQSSPGSDGVNDAVQHLIFLLQQGFDAGYRRMYIDRPAGRCGTAVPSSAYWTLPEWKRTAIQGALATWIADRKADDCTFEIGVYLGWVLLDVPDTADDGDPCRVLLTPWVNPDYSSQHQMDVMLSNIQPWIDAGFNAVWFDAATGPDWSPVAGWGAACTASGYSDAGTLETVALQQSPDYADVRFGWEVFPLDRPSCATTFLPPAIPDTDLFVAPYMQSESLWHGINGPWAGSSGPSDNPDGTWPAQWNLLESNAEFNLLFDALNPGYTTTITTIAAYKAHGINPWYLNSASHVRIDQYIRRVYDFGPICQADFNGDGCVTSADYTMFINQYFTYGGLDGTFYEGDINNDGIVNSTDVSDFYAAYINVQATCDFSGCNCDCTGFIEDFGPSE